MQGLLPGEGEDVLVGLVGWEEGVDPEGSHDLNGKGSGAAAAVGWGGWSWGAGPSPLSGMVLQHLSQRQGKVWLVGSEVGDDAGRRVQ